MKRSILIILLFEIIVIGLTGCSKFESEAYSSEEENQNIYSKNYLDDYQKENFDLSTYYLKCSSKSELIAGHKSNYYWAYYFDKEGNTRKACHYHDYFSTDENYKIMNDCNINLDSKNSNINDILKNNDNSCQLYLIKEELETKYDYNINEFLTMKEVTDKFIQSLNSSQVNYSYIEYENSKYDNGIYKTVKIQLNDEDNIILKFSNKEELMLIELIGKVGEIQSKTYENARLAMVKYFEFSENNLNDIFNVFVLQDEVTIGNFKISNYPTVGIFVIQDERF